MEKTVHIGDKDYPIQRFRGLKAILAMAAMTRIVREVPDILADVTKEYTRRHVVFVTEGMARLPRWSGFTTEDFDTAEASTGKREIELPAPMSPQEQLLQAMPRLLEQARKEVVRLLAILIVPNAELQEADENDRVEQVLDQHKNLLLYEAELDELADLALAAHEVLTDQLSSRKDRLGKMVESLVNLFRWGQQAQTLTGPATTTESEPEGQTTIPPTSTPDAPTSSISSESTTGGDEEKLSTASPGASLSS